MRLFFSRINSICLFLFYRAEIFYPSMRALALKLGKERDYEVLISGSQSLLPPPGASEVEVKAWQVYSARTNCTKYYLLSS